jgi:imidazolonepropionase-like amidohydrolase
MTGWHVRAVLLPDGDVVEERWLTAGGWSQVPVPGAEDLPGRFALPGLVDAHSHVSFTSGAGGPTPLDRDGAEANRARWARDGVGLVRDAGGDPGVVLTLPSSPGRPRLVAAGRHLAPAGMYFESVHLPVEPDSLIETALSELAAGARWVKLVADFSSTVARQAGEPTEPEPSYDLALMGRLVTAVHRAGARVAAHVTTALVADMVRLGIDSVEHGTALDDAVLSEMVRRGTAWTPTLCAVLSAPPDAPEERRRLVAQRRERLHWLLPKAVAAGIPVLTGSDVVGSVPQEVALFVECGVETGDALRAATTTATAFLSADLPDGPPPAVVTYDADPRNDPEVLMRPTAVVLDGMRVR